MLDRLQQAYNTFFVESLNLNRISYKKLDINNGPYMASLYMAINFTFTIGMLQTYEMSKKEEVYTLFHFRIIHHFT